MPLFRKDYATTVNNCVLAHFRWATRVLSAKQSQSVMVDQRRASQSAKLTGEKPWCEQATLCQYTMLILNISK